MDRHVLDGPDDGPDTLLALRHATAGRHAAIEELLDLRRPFGRAHYGRVLQGFAAFLAGWEPRVTAVLPDRLQGWFADGRRLHLLQDDLEMLGLDPAASDVPAPEMPSLAHALGSLYVIEGSALGGQVIAAEARRQLGLTGTGGASYFQGAGRDTAARWRGFRALLAQELDGDADGGAAAVRAAQATFDALTATFRPLLHDRAAA